jgi:hypothetical protein
MASAGSILTARRTGSTPCHERRENHRNRRPPHAVDLIQKRRLRLEAGVSSSLYGRSGDELAKHRVTVSLPMAQVSLFFVSRTWNCPSMNGGTRRLQRLFGMDVHKESVTIESARLEFILLELQEWRG